MNQLTLNTDSITVTITAAEYELARPELENLEENFQMFTNGERNPKLTFDILSTRKSFEKAFANDADAKPRFRRLIEKLQLMKWEDEDEAIEAKKAPFTHSETGEQGIIGLDGMFYPIETVEAAEAEAGIDPVQIVIESTPVTEENPTAGESELMTTFRKMIADYSRWYAWNTLGTLDAAKASIAKSIRYQAGKHNQPELLNLLKDLE